EYLFFYFEHNVPELEKLTSDRWRENAVLLKCQREVRKYLDAIDLYFCPFSTLYPRPLPIPTVYTLPDIQEVFYPEFFTYSNRVARAYHFAGSSLMADRVITHSDFSRKSLVRFHRISADKIIVAPHCVDKRFYLSEDDGAHFAKKLPDNFILYPANRWLHKNHDLLLKAILWLKEEKKVLVNVVFTGFDQENGYPLEKKVEEYDLRKQVYTPGYVSDDELSFLYRHADALVFPSLFEGFGLPLVEAMAAGCPVLAANTTSLPEIGGNSVCFFDPGSHEELGTLIAEVLNNEDLRNDLRRKGFARAEKFSPQVVAEKHLQAFSEARSSFSRSRYLWNRYYYKYIHIGRTIIKAMFLLPLRRKGDVGDVG
ncbi:MAG TPA: glycosyltransferase family 1 protein, partial [Desulfobacteraceae bacterium]|nr:glycosyltransferase family 1 protein [Desulfobacteraceae bacterium]